ncbi:MAG: type II secretion system F family protein [Tepidanaerobacteraceae bacterium]
MALYFYKGKSLNGEEISGILNSESKHSVARRIKTQGLVPIKIKEINENSLSYIIRVLFKRASSRDLSVFCRQFGAMLDAGVSVLESLSFIARQTKNRNLHSIYTDICWQLKCGYSLADALRNYPYVYSDVFVSMIEAGEASGNLGAILKTLSDYYSNVSMRHEKVKNSMTYPVLLGLISFGVVNFLTIHVLPVYANMFASYGVKLPIATQMLIWINSHMLQIVLTSLTLFLISLSVILKCTKSEESAYKLDKLKLSIPFIGPLITKNEACKIIRVLNILIASGIPILKALDIASNTAKNRFIKREVQKIKIGLKQGDNLSGLLSYKVFPQIMVKMIAIGEESGTLEDMLDKVAAIYENDVDIMLERMMSLVEPVIIIILTVIISFIVISVILPMFEIYNLF